MVKLLGNYFTKMFTLFLGLTVIVGLQTTGVSYANSGVPALTVVKTVTGGGTTLAIGVDGNIHRENPDKTWSVVYTGFRNGASDLVYANNRFYATSFFQGAHSTNGNSWTTFTLPLGERFNPGNILPDSKVFTRTQMSVNEIQDFLNRMGGECRSGYVCLKDYRETTYDRAANVMCREYKGRSNETAAQIIHKVSQACNVSAEVLIVMLQKEQGLVTHTWPSQTRYNIAMGYACPDTAPCDSLFFGFYNQVYNAARQLVRYSNPPGTSNFFTWYPVGRTTTVRWHPNVSCGGSPVFIENQATASFYYYTPYQPNTAALVAFSAVGDSCSAYGNRNLWRLYHQWFNSDAKYNTFIAHNGRVFVSVDMDGTIAISSNGTSWVREPSTPVKTNEKVSNFYTNGDRFIIALTNGNGYSSTNGVSWSSFNNPEQRPAQFVVGIEGVEPPPVVENTTPPANETVSRVVTRVVDYTVVRGDTVWGIASRLGSTVNSIVSLNNLPNGGALIFVGQRLKVEITEIVVENVPAPPVAETPAPPVVEVPKEDPPVVEVPKENPPVVEVPRETTQTPVVNVGQTTHTVVRGDTVWSIARQYSTTVANIVQLNRLPNGGALIFVGQRLTISGSNTTAPAPTPAPSQPVSNSTYTVKAGDTLWRIASIHNTTVTWLAANNNIRNVNLIRPGMVLTVR